jgi:hypothetical protein
MYCPLSIFAMKTTLFLFLFGLGIVQVEAQQTDFLLAVNIEEPLVYADQESRQMQRNLLLNEKQFIKIMEINQRRRQHLASVQALFAKEPEVRDERIYEMEVQFDTEFAAVLTKKQFEEYLELNGRTLAASKKSKGSNGPTFNEKIHAIIEKAINPSDSLPVSQSSFSENLPQNAGDIGSPPVKDAGRQISLNVKDFEGGENRARQLSVISGDMILNQTNAGKQQPGNTTK